MTAIMLFHLRSKYTAVGRKEICLFFYIYVFVELLAIFLDSTVIPTAHAVYPWFTAVYAGAVGALYWCIMVNGFVGFQLYEDGTPFSLWVSDLHRLLSLSLITVTPTIMSGNLWYLLLCRCVDFQRIRRHVVQQHHRSIRHLPRLPTGLCGRLRCIPTHPRRTNTRRSMGHWRSTLRCRLLRCRCRPPLCFQCQDL